MMLPPDDTPSGLLSGRSNRRLQDLAGGVLIVLAVLVVYGPALPGDVLWDDDLYVSENPLLITEGGLWRIWVDPDASPQYYPLVFTSFWLEARLWDLSTFGLHLVNALLHAGNALLLWVVLRRLEVRGAWLAGVLFALHPVHVESVAWITERKNVLSGMFMLLSIIAFVRHTRGGQRVWYGLALLAFVAALLSKTATCFLPVILLLVRWWRRPGWARVDLAELSPFFGIGLAFGIITILQEKHDVGATGAEWALTWGQRVLLANQALWFYVGKMFCPSGLTFNYPRWTIDTAAPSGYVFPLLTILAVGGLWAARRRVGRGPVVALGLYVAGLSPVLGIFNVYYFRYSYVADHFQYHASMPLIALVAALLAQAATGASRSGQTSSRPLALLVLVLPVVLGVLTYRQAALYTDVRTLWRETIARNPHSWLARYNLALVLVRDHERDADALQQAQAHLRTVLKIKPDCLDAHIALGNIARWSGQPDSAVDHYRMALDIDPLDPRAHYNLGITLEDRGDLPGAARAYRASLEGDEAFGPAHSRLGKLLLNDGDDEAAMRHFEQAFRSNPRDPSAPLNLGKIHEARSEYVQAIHQYERALLVHGGLAEAWFRIGVCRRLLGDVAAAESAYLQALAIKPDYIDARIDLAELTYAVGELDQAAERYQQALALNPENSPCRTNLARIHQEMGQDHLAVRVLEEGLRSRPQDLNLVHHLAKLLASSKDPAIRDGARAVVLATEVVMRTTPDQPEPWMTLGFAQAEVGDRDEAVRSMERAVKLASELGRTGLEQSYAHYLEAYRANPDG
ncbi:MAG: tetratricopeptide repeat protein [bacterium]|nr:tetratricopeptide repeat protein [bacterium]